MLESNWEYPDTSFVINKKHKNIVGRSEYTGQCGTMLKAEEKPNQKIPNTMSAKHNGWERYHTHAHTLPSWFGDFWLHDHGQEI